LKQIRALRDVQFVQALDFPTVDVDVIGARGPARIKVSDVTRSLVGPLPRAVLRLQTFGPTRPVASVTIYSADSADQNDVLEDLKNVPVNADLENVALAQRRHSDARSNVVNTSATTWRV